jgi:hypothetical protein
MKEYKITIAYETAKCIIVKANSPKEAETMVWDNFDKEDVPSSWYVVDVEEQNSDICSYYKQRTD